MRHLSRQVHLLKSIYLYIYIYKTCKKIYIKKRETIYLTEFRIDFFFSFIFPFLFGLFLFYLFSGSSSTIVYTIYIFFSSCRRRLCNFAGHRHTHTRVSEQRQNRLWPINIWTAARQIGTVSVVQRGLAKSDATHLAILYQYKWRTWLNREGTVQSRARSMARFDRSMEKKEWCGGVDTYKLKCCHARSSSNWVDSATTAPMVVSTNNRHTFVPQLPIVTDSHVDIW